MSVTSGSDMKMPCSICGEERTFAVGTETPVCGTCLAKSFKNPTDSMPAGYIRLNCVRCDNERTFADGTDPRSAVCGQCLAKEVSPIRAAADQTVVGMREVAPVCWAFFAALKEEGFQRDEALILTKSWLDITFGGGK